MANILILEEDFILSHLIVSTLRDEGHQLEAASNSRVALEIAKDAQHFDLVLADTALGAKVARYLIRARRPAKFLFLSKYGSFIDAISDSSGDESVLRKPFTADELRRRVRKILAGVSKKNKPPLAGSRNSLERAVHPVVSGTLVIDPKSAPRMVASVVSDK